MEAGLPVQILLPLVIATLMLGVGTSLRLADFIALLSMPSAAGLGLFNLFLLFPGLAFGIAWALELPADSAIGLVLLAASPSASTSTLFTYLARGDTALSVSLTAISKLLPALTIPLYVALADVTFAGDAATFSLSLTDTTERVVLVVLLPLVAGMAFRSRFAAAAAVLRPRVMTFGVIALVLLIALLAYRERAVLPGMIQAVGPAALLLCLLGMACAYGSAALARLNGAQRTALTVEVGMQSGGTAIAIAAGVLAAPAFAVPAAVYSVLMYPAAFLFVLSRRLAPPAGLSPAGR